MLAALTLPFTHFHVPLEIVVLGAVSGLTYGLLGLGLTLVYKLSRVINLAHGEIGALAAVVVPVLVINHHVNYWLALVLALAVATALGALTELIVVRRLARAPRLRMLVATIGLAQLLYVFDLLIPRSGRLGSATYPTAFRLTLSLGSLRVGPGSLMILIAVPLITAGMTLYLRLTRAGIATRAAAENEEMAQLVGVPVRRTSFLTWTLAGLLAGISGVLIGPSQPLVAAQALGPVLLVRALGAATIGGFDNLVAVFCAGIGIGVLEALFAWNYPSSGAIEPVLLGVILLSLLWRRGLGQRARGGEASSWSLVGGIKSLESRVAALPAVQRARRAALGGAVAFAIVIPLPLSESKRIVLSSVALFAVTGLSVVVLTGFAGQISLGQFAFVGLGALVGGRLHQLGYPGWVALVYAVAAGGLAAVLMGIPALRIRGLFLAVTTLAFGVMASSWLFLQPWLVRNATFADTSLVLPRWHLLGIDFENERNYYWLCLALLIAVATGVHRLRSTGVGRAMIAVRDNEPSAAALSISPQRAKLTAFVLSGMIASLAGYFYGGLLVNFGDLSVFGPVQSLSLVAMVIVGGVTTVTGAVLGAVSLIGFGQLVGPLVPHLLGGRVRDYFELLSSGVGLLLVVLQFPDGLVGQVLEQRDRVVARLLSRHPAPPQEEPRDESLPAVVGGLPDGNRGGAPRLVARDIEVRFGGNVAVRGVSLTAEPGEVVGLVGPNGAGKTTLFDVLSGHLRPAGGTVEVGGVDITLLPPHLRARRGVGRTFQQARLFDELTLTEAVQVALESGERAEVVPSLLAVGASRVAEARKRRRAQEVIDLFGLGPYADHQIKELSTGLRRLSELSCITALGAGVLLLDEPMAGLAQREVEAFQPVLRTVQAHLGATVVVIDHDIPMITELVDRLYVLAAGEVIAEGPPRILREDPRVVAAYLGTDERVIARSGTRSSTGPGPGRRTAGGRPTPRAAGGAGAATSGR